MSTLTNSQNRLEGVATRKLWWVALAAGVVAFISNLIVFFVAQNILGLSLMIPPPSDNTVLEPLSVGLLFVTNIVPAIGATILLAILARFVARPFRVFQIIAAVFLLVSFGGPISLPVETSTIVVLSVMHVVAAVAIVGVLTRLARQN